jgi:hypothetical protein
MSPHNRRDVINKAMQKPKVLHSRKPGIQEKSKEFYP